MNPDTTYTEQPATAPAKPAGIYLPCPLCGDEDAAFHLHLEEPDTLTCQACDNELTTERVRDLIHKWGPVLDWIDTMPA